jgi:hypothetical protein
LLAFSEVHTSDEEGESRVELGGEESRGEEGDTQIPEIKITTVDSLNGSPVSKVKCKLIGVNSVGLSVTL